MKGIESHRRKKSPEILYAIAEGLWTGTVISAVMFVSTILIKLCLDSFYGLGS